MENFARNKSKKFDIEELKSLYLNKEVFHEYFKEGKIIDIIDGFRPTIVVEFSSGNKNFEYPDVFEDGFLILGKKKDVSEMNYHEKEIEKEKEYAKKCIESCQNHINNDRLKDDDTMSYDMYDLDFETFEKLNNLKNEGIRDRYLDNYSRIIKEPFFASFQTDKYGLLYIGKRKLDNLVVHWSDPRCSSYYNYTYLSADSSIGIKLIRDHTIRESRYKDFVDKFNILTDENSENFGFNLESTIDKNLIKVIENERKSKQIHEIIETIQTNQYKIISSLDSKNIVVSGCAGSGKTMVLFHRIAYLAFNETLFVPQNQLVISASKLLEREANILSKELQIDHIVNLDIKSVYESLLKEFIFAADSTYFYTKSNFEILSNPKYYEDEFLEKLKEETSNLMKNHLEENYYKYREESIYAKLKYIYEYKYESGDSLIDLYKSFFTTHSASYTNQKYVRELVKKGKLYNLDRMYLNKKLNESESKLYEFLRDNLNFYLDKDPEYDNEGKNFSEFLSYMKKPENIMMNYPSKLGNTIFLRGIERKAFPKIFAFTYDYLILRSFFSNIYSYIYLILNAEGSETLDEEELNIYKKFYDLFIPFKSFFDNYKTKGDLRIAVFTLRNKLLVDNKNGYCYLIDSVINLPSAILLDYLSNKDEIDYFINLMSRVNKEQVENYKFKDLTLEVFLHLFSAYLEGESELTESTEVLDQILDYVKKDKFKHSLFIDESYYETLINIHDSKIIRHNFDRQIFYMSKIPYQILDVNNNFTKNKTIPDFMKKHLINYLDHTSFVNSPKKFLNANEEISRQNEYVDYFVKRTDISYKKNSIYYKNLNSYVGLINLYDFLTLKKEISDFVDYKDGYNDNEIFYIVEYLLKDYEINNHDKLFVMNYVLSDYFKSKKTYERIYIDEFQNYSIKEIALLKKVFNSSKFEFYGDMNQKVEEKGLNDVSEIVLNNLERFDLTTNYRNAYEICQYLNDTFNMNMTGVGIKGIVKETDKNEILDVSNKDDRTVLIVKNRDLIKDIKFKENIKIKIIDADTDYIMRNAINILSVEDVKGLEFEKVYVIPEGMNENEKYIAYTRALNELIVIK